MHNIIVKRYKNDQYANLCYEITLQTNIWVTKKVMRFPQLSNLVILGCVFESTPAIPALFINSISIFEWIDQVI